MTAMNNQQQTDKYIETTSDFLFNDYVKNPQKNKVQVLGHMKYVTRVVKIKSQKNQ